MHKKIYSLFISALLFSTAAFSQGSALKVNVLDKKNNQPIPFVNVVLYANGVQVAGAQTDFDGNAQIKPLNAGNYTIKAAILGYQGVEMPGVTVIGDKIAFATIKMSASAQELKEVEIVTYTKPLFEKDNTTNVSTMTKDEITQAPTRDINSLASTSAGVYQQSDNAKLNVRGSRDDATTYYVDGVKVTATNLGLPKSAIEQLSTITGGIPAQYGDATGGIINITSRGPSREFHGGVSAESSQFLDAFGHNLAEASLSGPLYNEKDKTKQPKAGFFVATQFNTDKDQTPGAVGAYVVNSDKLAQLKANPLSYNLNNNLLTRNADYITNSDLEKLKYNPNNRNTGFAVNGKIEFLPFKGATLAVGGNYSYQKNKNYDDRYSLLAYDNFGDIIRNNWRGFVRFTQKLDQGEENTKSAAVVKNIFYTAQIDYNKNYQVVQDSRYQDNIFNYGYVGKFKTYTSDKYQFTDPETKKLTVKNGVDSIKYIAPDYTKPDQIIYTQEAYTFAKETGTAIKDPATLSNFGGYGNGNFSNSTVGSVFFNTGSTPGRYGIVNNQQFHAAASGSLDIKDHAISFGVDFEQRTNRSYDITPDEIWQNMRQLANKHIGLDTTASHITVIKGPQGQNINQIDYAVKSDATQQSTFDKNFRTAVKGSATDASYLDIDNYDPSSFKLSYFGADELIRDKNLNLRYYGYTYDGQVAKAQQNIADFYNNKDTRVVGAFQPNYIAAYLQDKFAFRDLIFNIGVRFDRYDANQKVIKDIYSFYNYRTANDPLVAKALSNYGMTRPSNIGDDYAVYVNDFTVDKPQVVGYRKGDVWYSEKGTVVDYTYLKRGPTIAPYLIDPSAAKAQNLANSFTDYIVQYNLMPRIAFSFPISDEALFYAHYDVLTKRPGQSASQLDPFQYLTDYGANPYNGGYYTNPALKPERTTEYALGFKQKISASSAITIEGFYRELRDMVGLRQIRGAYPLNTYQTYTNSDFGTVKGLSLSYDLRRTKNIRLNAAYTLSFADGTGSDQNTSSGLVNESTPYIRAIFPLTYDQRHTFVTSVDYRYGSKEEYNGPVIGGKRILEDAGVNFILRAGSGTPYTQAGNVVTDLLIGSQNQSGTTTLGSINGSNLAWNFRADMKIDKNIDIKWKKGAEKAASTLNIYLQVQNLFDNLNILKVFRYTGTASDDGYLNTALAAQRAQATVNPQAYYDLYSARLNNSTNANGYYNLPRRIIVGLSLSF